MSETTNNIFNNLFSEVHATADAGRMDLDFSTAAGTITYELTKLQASALLGQLEKAIALIP